MRVIVVTPPAVPVVSLDQAKDHLRVRHDDEDALITAYIAAATAHIDGPGGWLGRALGDHVLEARFDTFECIGALPYPPVIEVESVKYIDGDGVETTVAPSVYEVRGTVIGTTWGQSWPSPRSEPEAVRIRYRAGYQILPSPILAAILLMVGDLYRNRGEALINQTTAQVAMSTTVQNLLAPFRVYR